MSTHEKHDQSTDNKDFDPSEGFTAGDVYPNCEGESCANMAGDGDTVSGTGGDADATTTATDSTEPKTPAPPTPQEEAAMWKDKFMRQSAEYENYRKRTLKEKLDLVAAGGEDVVRSILDVLDDMDRALEAMAKTDDMEAVKQGIALIDTKLRCSLKARGLTEIEALGSHLDTDLHEAVARIAVEEKERKGRIIDVVQKGYKLREKIIRYAKVVVGQ